jgi:hypothetical protein
MPDDRVLDRVQGTKSLLSEQETNSRKTDPRRKQIIQTHSNKKTTKKQLISKRYIPLVKVRVYFYEGISAGKNIITNVK